MSPTRKPAAARPAAKTSAARTATATRPARSTAVATAKSKAEARASAGATARPKAKAGTGTASRVARAAGGRRDGGAGGGADRLPGSIYSMHPAFRMEQAAIANLPARTGKTLEEWLSIIRRTGPSKSSEVRTWLQATHGVTRGYAGWLAGAAAGGGFSLAESYNPEAHVAGLFAGAKAALLPIYDALLALGFSLGADVKACPCKTFVPLYRERVFAQLKPTTRTRIDLGLALADTPAAGRLIDTGGYAKKDRITHRIEITSLAEIDDEVKRWLKKAYLADA